MSHNIGNDAFSGWVQPGDLDLWIIQPSKPHEGMAVACGSPRPEIDVILPGFLRFPASGQRWCRAYGLQRWCRAYRSGRLLRLGVVTIQCAGVLRGRRRDL